MSAPLTALRIGHGFDVHAFAPGRRLVLGGVEIPCERGLLGHSDADVVAHALADAVLGACRGGDIGKLFPDTDPAFEGADSLVLLGRTMELARSLGCELVDADCTVAAQAPSCPPTATKCAPASRAPSGAGTPIRSAMTAFWACRRLPASS